MYIKVCNELSESVKGFGEKIDEITEKYIKDLNSDDPVKMEFAIHKANMELKEIGVVSNADVREKLEKLDKKHYK